MIEETDLYPPIYAIGASYDGNDESGRFIRSGIIGIGWDHIIAPDLHILFKYLKQDDIIYIKSYQFGIKLLTVKAIGRVADNNIIPTNPCDSISRNVNWLPISPFTINMSCHQSKFNVRCNTMYQEFHPYVLSKIRSII